MKIRTRSPRRKTTVTLPEELLQEVDEMSKEYRSRSEFIEIVLRGFVAQRKREERDARDLAIINANADRLNAEAEDVLSFVGELHEAW